MSRRQRGEVLRLIMVLASRPDGVSRGELAERLGGLPTNAPILTTAADRGHVVKAHRKGEPMRYFVTAQNAAEWLAREPEPKPAKVKPPKPEKTATVKKPAATKMGAKKPHIPKPADHQKPPTYTAGPSKKAPQFTSAPIITERTRVTVAPTPLPRFHVPDDFRGAFSQAGIGRDVQTGRGWA